MGKVAFASECGCETCRHGTSPEAPARTSAEGSSAMQPPRARQRF